MTRVWKLQNFLHRDGENDRNQDDREDAAEADYQDAGEVGLQEIQIKKPMIIRNPAERPRDVVSHDSRKT